MPLARTVRAEKKITHFNLVSPRLPGVTTGRDRMFNQSGADIGYPAMPLSSANISSGQPHRSVILSASFSEVSGILPSVSS